jgi:hypothetical protein
MARLEAWDFGRPGGGDGVVSVDCRSGELGSDADSGVGAKLDRTRMADLLGGGAPMSAADAERAGGGGGVAPPGLGPVIPGDAVCGLEGGGGGGAAGLTSSPPA